MDQKGNKTPPALGTQTPRRGNALTRWIARTFLRLWGWTYVGTFPDIPKGVFIAGPHTSNWDLPVALAVIFAMGIDGKYLAKHTIFWWPMSVFWRWTGGTPVVRGGKLGAVEQTVERMNAADKFMLMISPEGTRSRVKRWKTGFYHIALNANVPIVAAHLDFATKRMIFGEPLMPTGDIDADIEKLQGFMYQFEGKRANRMSNRE